MGGEIPIPEEAAGSGLAYGSDPGRPGWLTAGPGVLDPLVGEEIHSSRLSPDGGLLSGPRQISDDPDAPAGFPHDNPQAPAIAYNAVRNEFLVVWAQGFRIWARRLDGHGSPLGDPYAISSVGRDHYAPRAVHNPDRDEYVVVWADQSEGSPDPEMQVRSQRLSGTAQEVGSNDLQISSNPAIDAPGVQGYGFGWPEIAYNPAGGGYLVVWAPTYFRDRGEQVVAQLLDASAAQIGPDDFHPVGAGPPADGHSAEPTVASDGRSYLLAWAAGHEVRAQLLSASGVELGADDFAVSDMAPAPDPFPGAAPAVASNRLSGGWLVGWEGADVVDGALTDGIFGQHLAPDGSELGGDDFLVTSGHRGLLAVAPSMERPEYLFIWRHDGLAAGRRVQSPSCAPAGGCPAPTSPAGGSEPGSPDARLPALGAITAGLSRSLLATARSLRRLGLNGLLRRRRFALTGLRVLTPGRLTVTLTARPLGIAAGAAPMMLARGTRAVSAPGRIRLVVALTRRGRRALSGLARARLRLEIRFRDGAGRVASARRPVVMRRLP